MGGSELLLCNLIPEPHFAPVGDRDGRDNYACPVGGKGGDLDHSDCLHNRRRQVPEGKLCLACYWQRVCKNDRLVGCPVKMKRMFHERVHTRRKHHALLRRAGKDVAAFGRASIEPVGIVECAAAHSEDVRKSFQIQVERRATAAAEID